MIFPPQRRSAREVERSACFDRVDALPRRTWSDVAADALAARLTAQLRAEGGTQSLRRVQALALIEAAQSGGLMAPIRVGGGKTLISFLLPRMISNRKPLLLVPASLVEKTEEDFRALRKHWVGARAYWIESYEKLGRDSAAKLLEQGEPDLIVCDEAHRLKNPGAAVTKRVSRYVRECRKANRKLSFVFMTGTVIVRSIAEFAHLANWALGDGAPTPQEWVQVQAWAAALDAQVPDQKRFEPGVLGRWVDRGDRRPGLAPLRAGYRRRLTQTPGVIATQEPPLDVPLTITSHLTPDCPALEEAFRQLRTTGETPDGHPCADAIEIYRHAKELASGFYYRSWSQSRFVECLKKADWSVGKDWLGSGDIVTLKNAAQGIESDTELAKALAILRFEPPTAERIRYCVSTVSARPNLIEWCPRAVTSATSAEGLVPQARAADCTWITAMRQVGFAASSVKHATSVSAFWAILLTASPELLSIFRTAEIAARPPDKWLLARSAWAGACRHILAHNRSGLDSEGSVAKAIRKGAYPEHAATLAAWDKIKNSFDPEKNREAVWLSDEPVQQILELASAGEPCIIWVTSDALGMRLAEFGMPWYGQGAVTAEGRSIMRSSPANGTIVASVLPCSTGQNLQERGWHRSLVVELPQHGGQWEQMIGRTHRDGQTRPVTVEILFGCREDVTTWYKSLDDAACAEEITGQAQKLVHADAEGVHDWEKIGRLSGWRWKRTRSGAAPLRMFGGRFDREEA